LSHPDSFYQQKRMRERERREPMALPPRVIYILLADKEKKE
jgi:hypothetical protein